jgi:hypothetical protein
MSQSHPPTTIIIMFLSTLIFWQLLDAYPAATVGSNRWELLLPNIGNTTMHMQLLQNERAIIFDRTHFGQSNFSLPNGKCRHYPKERVLKVDYTTHSLEYDVAKNTIWPLFI